MKINWFSLFREPDVESIKKVVDRLFRIKGVRQKDIEAIAEGLAIYSKESGSSAEAIADALNSLFAPKFGTMAITQKDTNDSTTNTISVVAHPSGNDTLNPPASLATGVTQGGGYYKCTGWELDGESNGVTFASDELIVDTDGLYVITVGWGGFRHTANATTVSFVLGVDTGQAINLSPRPTSAEVPNGDDLGNIAGGGQLRLKAGDKLSVWLAASKTGDIILGNANLTVMKIAN